MEEPKFRHELKHMVSQSDAIALRQRLRAVASPDTYAGGDGRYLVRSLYFDNIQDKALREKIDGVNRREKFRIRCYNYQPGPIKVEKKSKVAGLCAKESALITRGQCEALLSGDTEWMLECGSPLLVELYAKMKYQQLRPKTVVDYTREAFVYAPGNVRVTLDSGIMTGIHSTDFFNPRLPTLPAGTQGAPILEVKFDEFLPSVIAGMVQMKHREPCAFSKYAVCRIYG
ncbi:polyphosphate polymerase domain-containing protein [Zongyangia hominis]|uniref:Polyphosphate polymerase domain-containing protein n=1 Tax=Zongyangia hominis TaxID=2763677 RepID=A0A926EC72_9FIRM|nr:polyphosphate polymerase domain-containing protein [Zongyangia hominis]MBC8569276.1 polyphosphate polymerase domain-containing protein [Zongyangia hominis]